MAARVILSRISKGIEIMSRFKSLVFAGFIASCLLQPLLAHQPEVSDEPDTSVADVSEAGFAFTFGMGGSSLELDDEGETSSSFAAMARLDRYRDGTSYALQYAALGAFPFTDIVDDFFDCLFTDDEDCDEDDENSTTLSDLSLMYGWHRPKVTYSLGISYLDSENTIDKDDDYHSLGLVANMRGRLFWFVDGVVHANINDEDSFAIVFIGFRIE